MNRDSRSYKAFNNMRIALVCQILYFGISFVCRTIFIRLLGAEYLGINGLFGNILNFLSLAELGFEEALIYRMYKPVALSDQEKVKTWVDFCRKMFRLIFLVVAGLGLAVLPFLKFLVQAPQVQESVPLLYSLFLANSLTSFIFVHRYTILLADQRNYLVTIYRFAFNIILNLAQITALLLTRNYVLYLLLMIATNILNNIFCSKRATRDYPFLRDKKIQPVSPAEKSQLWLDIKSTALNKIGALVFEQTDYIMISLLLGISYIGYVSNYLLLINTVNGTIGQVIGSISASVGNLHVLEGEKKKLAAFQKIYFINAWIYGYIACGFMLLLNKFIGEIWLSREFLLPLSVMYVLVLKFYLNGVHFCAHVFRKSMGFFSQFRWVPLLAALGNIVLVILLFPRLGLTAIFLAPLLIRSLFVEPVDIYVIYKNAFQLSFAKYYLQHLAYAALFATLFFFLRQMISHNPLAGLTAFMLDILVISLVFNGAMLLIFGRTALLQDLVARLKASLAKASQEQLK